ncbi:FAD-dependent oxidoreductase [Haloechinothrix sp. YIM 98757]|uniref:3-oxosteroid 1-dehydrogenase n=1 Tax=Haloechinothrix aidingensis TaxID=2752311 RepID=A0A838ABE3_9PSEU|nr:FAD-dependent oxidoreductase [Haloechinothrix aidingensis]MBA0126559.1 FAD-dependent oxidoreductase [Haloechinothrix aidingensis]
MTRESSVDYQYDVVVAGSGAAGMTAALTARYKGLSVLLIEKSRFFGGSTARSGGGIWIPNNHVLRREGVPDDPELARTYIKAVVGERVPDDRLNAYLDHGAEMLSFLTERSPYMRFLYDRGYADYYPELPGGLAQGRTIEPEPIDGNLLGRDLRLLNSSSQSLPKGVAFTATQFHDLNMVTRTRAGKRTALAVLGNAVRNIATKRAPLAMGKALVARLWLAMRDAGVDVWLRAPLAELTTDGAAVTGVRAERDGQRVTVRADRGVVLAAGGFEHNLDMRREHLSGPVSTDWTVGSPGNTGDAIQAGKRLGAALDLMDDAWWGPCVRTPDGPPFFCVAERSQPGSLMVNDAGRRFTNEAACYVDVVHEMYRRHGEGVGHIPAHFIMDQRFRNRYLFLGLFPRQEIPAKYYEAGIVTRADSLTELAERIGVPAETFTASVERFNRFAHQGKDEDFGRGESAYDRYYGDPTISPNPCLAPVDQPPFYAVEMVPGDLGTKGGLVTDELARVLDGDGTPIGGLYSAGNNSASVMGNSYAGAGATIGPAMVFGYIAARHLAGGTRESHGPTESG